MRHHLHSSSVRALCYTLIAALVSTFAPTPLVSPARAQLMPQYSVGVVDFVNESGVQGELLARLATDAVVVEMAKSNRYDVSITRSQIRTEMDKLGLRPPLDKIGLVRLGEVLVADAMVEGSIKSVQLAGSGVTRRASVTLLVQMIDQASGEIINGTVQTGTSSARVGYTADDDSLIAEAVNNAAFLAVKTMVDYIIPEATVVMNIKSDNVMLNKGARDGMKQGMRMIVLRRKEIIGYVEIQNVSANQCDAKVIKSMRGIQPEDKVRAIFDMPIVGPVGKTEPLPSGAPPSTGSKRGTFSKIAKVLVGAGLVFGLVSLFRGGRGSEDAPDVSVSATKNTVLTWNPGDYGHGQNVLEYQILRDDFVDGAQPVMAVRDPSHVDAGRADVARIYGTATASAVTYYRLDANPTKTTPTSVDATVAAEPYGVTHTYQVRAVYKMVANSSGTATSTDTSSTTTSGEKYYYTPVSGTITATAIEQVKYTDIVSPAYDPNMAPQEVYPIDLQDGSTNLEWNRKDGANVYYVLIEPVIPGKGPTWRSSDIYETGPIVSLTAAQRIELASMINNVSYVDQVMKWRVYCRNTSDTSPAWTVGQEARFSIGGFPPVAP